MNTLITNYQMANILTASNIDPTRWKESKINYINAIFGFKLIDNRSGANNVGKLFAIYYKETGQEMFDYFNIDKFATFIANLVNSPQINEVALSNKREHNQYDKFKTFFQQGIFQHIESYFRLKQEQIEEQDYYGKVLVSHIEKHFSKTATEQQSWDNNALMAMHCYTKGAYVMPLAIMAMFTMYEVASQPLMALAKPQLPYYRALLYHHFNQSDYKLEPLTWSVEKAKHLDNNFDWNKLHTKLAKQVAIATDKKTAKAALSRFWEAQYLHFRDNENTANEDLVLDFQATKVVMHLWNIEPGQTDYKIWRGRLESLGASVSIGEKLLKDAKNNARLFR